MKKWYAVMTDREDNDWGTGSFTLSEATKMCKEINNENERNGFTRDGYIAVIDNSTDNPVCIEELDENGLTI